MSVPNEIMRRVHEMSLEILRAGPQQIQAEAKSAALMLAEMGREFLPKLNAEERLTMMATIASVHVALRVLLALAYSLSERMSAGNYQVLAEGACAKLEETEARHQSRLADSFHKETH